MPPAFVASRQAPSVQHTRHVEGGLVLGVFFSFIQVRTLADSQARASATALVMMSSTWKIFPSKTNPFLAFHRFQSNQGTRTISATPIGGGDLVLALAVNQFFRETVAVVIPGVETRGDLIQNSAAKGQLMKRCSMVSWAPHLLQLSYVWIPLIANRFPTGRALLSILHRKCWILGEVRNFQTFFIQSNASGGVGSSTSQIFL